MSFPTPLSLTLPDWEGPLDLLLHVIRAHELDILDIPMAFVTEQYLSYLDAMRAVDLDIAGEYLEMAATLTYIKSRMMLPDPPAEEADEGQGEEARDPREELVRRLLEYQRYKEAASQLAERPLLGRDTFPVSSTWSEDPGEAPLAELGLFDLAEALRRVMERTKIHLAHEITSERITISERIGELVERLRAGELTLFDELIRDAKSRFDIVITLLALLEMTRLRMTRLFQASLLGPLYVTLGGPHFEAAAQGQLLRGHLLGSGKSQADPWRIRTTTLPRPRTELPRTLQRLLTLRRSQRPTPRTPSRPSHPRPGLRDPRRRPTCPRRR